MDELLAACIRGDEEAWGLFVTRYAPVVAAAVNRVLKREPRDAGQSEDVIQDVFVRLVKDDFRLLRRFDPNRASLVTYVTVIAHSTASDAARRKQIFTKPLANEHDPTLEKEAPTDLVEIPSGLLSPRQAIVLKLLFDREMTPQEAGQVLGITSQSVRSTKHKAINRLREYFRDRQ